MEFVKPDHKASDDKALWTELQLWLQLGLIRPLDLSLVQMLKAQMLKAQMFKVQMSEQKAQTLKQKTPGPLPDNVWRWLALGSAQLAQGHLCLDLSQVLQQPALLLSPAQCHGKALALLQQWLLPQQLDEVLTQLRQAVPVVASIGQNEQQQQSSPYVLEGNRLYLRRYWQYEQQIKAYLQQSFQRTTELRQSLITAEVQPLLSWLFPGTVAPNPAQATAQNSPDWQMLGCAMAAGSSFSVITGGPGTGKTTTVVKLLLLLQQLQQQQGKAYLQIRLAAPTGKAAARLSVAITGALTKLTPQLGLTPELLKAVPAHAETLHRLLGVQPQQQGFKYHAGFPLPLDVLVVDEASMVDVAMFTAMLSALPPAARLILLGDKDQLASVEAGAILAELCRDASKGGYSAQTAKWLAAMSGQQLPEVVQTNTPGELEQQILMLRTSHRFGADSGIGQLAAAVNAGDAATALQLLQQGGRAGSEVAEISWLAQSPVSQSFQALVLTGQTAAESGKAVDGGFSRYLKLVQQGPAADLAAAATAYPAQAPVAANYEQWGAAVLEAFSGFALLCALRQGEYGVEQLNQRISQLLYQARLIQRTDGWYPGRPVMITQNDYATGLMNGDVGICLPRLEHIDGQLQQRLRVVFAPARHGEPLRWLMPSRLPALETVYAMTVHKSQGSEFRHAVLVLPDNQSAILNRELVYTGITRAVSQFSLICPSEAVLLQAIQSRTERSGGLRL
ncbi:exodeoxyribonuclease V subunit alpha [Rheinheimera sp. 4Y26]|uniref:exodeoxyribonuclease V subunit alpha n=1 Tax=Rheinheimera sp. 4Y26 TaxID=2977811 RepID=UPI0021B12E77|nr:exodeoxyribonuclease V subunit alpha [Rheinheimera sp. 4Y26]MCT6699651.1 exodeoxyribonuclease V subunit alpha [Rheinheimera sp. 4Y26]